MRRKRKQINKFKKLLTCMSQPSFKKQIQTKWYIYIYIHRERERERERTCRSSFRPISFGCPSRILSKVNRQENPKKVLWYIFWERHNKQKVVQISDSVSRMQQHSIISEEEYNLLHVLTKSWGSIFFNSLKHSQLALAHFRQPFF